MFAGLLLAVAVAVWLGGCHADAAAPGGQEPADATAVPGLSYTSRVLGAMNWIPDTGFWLMEHEVTQGQWRSVMGRNPSRFGACGDSCPVEEVSWTEASEFARLVSAREGVTYRLPTEQEWEAAARGGESFEYAGSSSVDAVAWHEGNSGGSTHPVCQKQRNAYALCDMSGNVWEWTSTEEDSLRVYRGGGWYFSPGGARIANRGANTLSFRYASLGFRLARSRR